MALTTLPMATAVLVPLLLSPGQHAGDKPLTPGVVGQNGDVTDAGSCTAHGCGRAAVPVPGVQLQARMPQLVPVSPLHCEHTSSPC